MPDFGIFVVEQLRKRMCERPTKRVRKSKLGDMAEIISGTFSNTYKTDSFILRRPYPDAFWMA